MTKIPFCGQTYTDKTLNANCQNAINLYPMRTPEAQYGGQKYSSGAPPEKIVMYPTPGYSFAQACAQYASAGTAIRGLFVINSILYIVCGNVLLSFTPTGAGNSLLTGTFATLGTLDTSAGIVSIVCNTVSLAISDGAKGYTLKLSDNTFAHIGTGGGFPSSGGCTNFTFYDGYVIAALNNSTTVIQSDVLDATTWGAQAFDSETSFPDNLIGVFSDELILYLFGPKLCEVQVDVGSIPYAFQKQAGVLIQAGCAAIATVVKVGNTIIWLASDYAGKSFVATLQGYGAKPISTPPINEAMERYSTVADAYAYTYREGDNQFYVITFPTAGATWAYDTKMDMWHQRSIAGGTDLPTAYVNWQGNHVVGDSSGNLLVMSQNYSTYYQSSNGKDIAMNRVRTCQHLNAEGKTMFINELWIDMQQGGGFITDSNLATQPATGTTPLATLEVSKNYGNTWINVGTKSMGAQGQYNKRVLWRTLGRFRQNATFRLTVTDPVGTYIIGAKAEVKVGKK